MANKRHLARLKQGVEAWNQWRESNPHINPDLSIADLTWMVPSEERLAQLVQVEEQLQHAVEAWKRWAVEADINGMVEVGSGNVRLRLRPGTNLHEFIIERVEVVEASDRSSEANPHIELITTREEVVWASDRSPEANPHIEPDLSGADPIKMACTQEHLTRLQQAVEAWDRSRAVPLDLTDAGLMGAVLRGVDLAGAHLTGAELLGTDFTGAHLIGADLSGIIFTEVVLRDADLTDADLSEAAFFETDLTRADLTRANLSGADLRDADLTGADLTRANLSGADLTRAQLPGATLQEAYLVQTTFEGANLTGCKIYGISAWNINLTGARQADLIITPADEPMITVDNLEVAQFIYLLLHNEKIRQVIDTVTSKAVLILGRFTPERKAVLDAMRDELRQRNYLPILFDFEASGSRDFTETISTLAHMARFIIADLTESSSLPKELEAIVPTLAVPVQPVLEGTTRPYSMFQDYWKYHWVLKVHRYEDLEGLIASLGDGVISPAEVKVEELEDSRKAITEELLKQRAT